MTVVTPTTPLLALLWELLLGAPLGLAGGDEIALPVLSVSGKKVRCL